MKRIVTPNCNGTSENQVEVKLTKGFWLGKYEATQAQWERVMGTDAAPAVRRQEQSAQVGEREPGYYTEWWDRNDSSGGH